MENDLLGYDEPSSTEEVDFFLERALQEEFDAATFVGLPEKKMTRLEQENLPEFMAHVKVYIEIRNVVLAAWHRDCTQYLTPDKATQALAEAHRARGRRVFAFLDQFGFVNSGIVSRRSRTAHVASGDKAKRICVLGAGASGLAAARQLRLFGHDVVVVEARDRVGGRVCTSTCGA
jgi:glycine/D-amino acid oxidase-like deaminating enzyme